MTTGPSFQYWAREKIEGQAAEIAQLRRALGAQTEMVASLRAAVEGLYARTAPDATGPDVAALLAELVQEAPS